ncbi:MAG: exodeoxyribonuclease VII small subunit [Pseudomonadales bacterium]
MPASKKRLNFEQNLEDLEALVVNMESGELSLEDSLAAFEKGIKLTRECQTALQKAEQRVQKLISDNGELSAVVLDDDSDPSNDD